MFKWCFNTDTEMRTCRWTSQEHFISLSVYLDDWVWGLKYFWCLNEVFNRDNRHEHTQSVDNVSLSLFFSVCHSLLLPPSPSLSLSSSWYFHTSVCSPSLISNSRSSWSVHYQDYITEYHLVSGVIYLCLTERAWCLNSSTFWIFYTLPSDPHV